MANLVGKWMLVSSENHAKVLEAGGMSRDDAFEHAAALDKAGSGGITEEFKYDGKKFTNSKYNPDGSMHSTFSADTGKWSVSYTLDYAQMFSRITEVSANEIRKEEKRQQHEGLWIIKVSGDDMTLTGKVKNVTCLRKYKKIQ